MSKKCIQLGTLPETLWFYDYSYNVSKEIYLHLMRIFSRRLKKVVVELSISILVMNRYNFEYCRFRDQPELYFREVLLQYRVCVIFFHRE